MFSLAYFDLKDSFFLQEIVPKLPILSSPGCLGGNFPNQNKKKSSVVFDIQGVEKKHC